MKASKAIVRSISDSFQEATVTVPLATPIDVALARRQHAAYVQALRACETEVIELPPLHELADACFVEDCAVQAEGVALVARPGAPSRVGEEPTVGDCLGQWMPTHRMTAPATLEGGDCLRIGKTMFVGRSTRTNEAGAALLASVFQPRGLRVVEVPVVDVLHLKCVCSPLDDERVLVAEGTIPREVFFGFQVIEVPAAEAYAANVVSLNGTVLMADGFPETKRLVAEAGFCIVTLDMSEIRKADGSLTCLSILIP